MTRKSQFEKLIDELTNAAWWISPLVGLVAYVFLAFIVPTIFAGNTLLAGLAGMGKRFAPLAFLFFCVIGVIAFFNQKRKTKLLDGHTGETSFAGLTWKEFEELVGEYYRRKGYKVRENFQRGPDGGVDLWLSKNGEKTMVQCKRWNNRKVGVKPVRELYGIMSAEGAAKGILATSGEFTDEARRFAAGKPIELMNGPKLSKLIQDLKSSRQDISAQKGLEQFKNEDIANQTQCPRCGSPMVVRTAKRSPNAGTQFLGCSRFPKCRGTVDLPN